MQDWLCRGPVRGLDRPITASQGFLHGRTQYGILQDLSSLWGPSASGILWRGCRVVPRSWLRMRWRTCLDLAVDHCYRAWRWSYWLDRGSSITAGDDESTIQRWPRFTVPVSALARRLDDRRSSSMVVNPRSDVRCWSNYPCVSTGSGEIFRK